ncbi:hypothetical protein [Cobetia sp. L2A1]|uniref:hypothetical protein n=1 Tax=Cobetia sp. L2A1 TaxID=2686360 RepID=UPI00131D759C|nr:hypothetical protein [Cobetia sp. L2A1]
MTHDTPESKTWLPEAILHQWEDQLGDLVLSASEETRLWPFLQRNLPPCSQADLWISANVQAMDDNDPSLLDLISKLLRLLPLAPGPLQTIRQSHPLHSHLTFPDKFAPSMVRADIANQAIQIARHDTASTPYPELLPGNAEQSPIEHNRRLIRLALRDMAGYHSGPLVDPSIYYQHLSTLRIALRYMLPRWNHPIVWSHSASLSLLSAWKSTPWLANHKPKLYNHLNRANELLSGHPSLGTRRTRYTKRSPQRSVFYQDTFKRNFSPVISNSELPENVDASLRPEEDEDDAASLEKERVAHQQEEETPFHRKGDSLLTPEDCRVIARKRQQTSIAQSLGSLSNFATTQGQVRRILKLPLPPDTTLLVQLILATGIAPRRLSQIRVADVTQEAMLRTTAASRDQSLQWVPESSTLYVPVIHAPSKCPPLPLRLPDTLATPLNQLSEATTQPLSKSLTLLNRRLVQHMELDTGTTPTAQRVVRAARHHILGMAKTDIEAEWLHGELSLKTAAPAAYRKMPMRELQRLMNASLEWWEIATPNKAISLPKNTQVITSLGSSVTLTLQTAKEALKGLHDLVQAGLSDFPKAARTQSHSQDVCSALIELNSALCCYTLLGVQLTAGLRPIGPTTRMSRRGRLLWIADKDSGHYRESRVIPLPLPICQNLDTLQAWQTAWRQHWPRNGGAWLSWPEDEQVLAMWWSRRKASLNLTAKPFQQTHMRDWISARHQAPQLTTSSRSALDTLQALPDNAPRHFVAQTLDGRLKANTLDMLLGHVKRGQQRHAPYASNICLPPEMQRLLGTLSDELRIKVLPLKDLP